MRILKGSARLESTGPFAVAIGIFDGVHLGHEKLLLEAKRLAVVSQGGVESLAYTFHPHPALVLAPDLAPRMLETVETRLERIAALGLSTTLVERFDHELAAASPEQFVRDILVDKLRVAHVIVGEDFTFGQEQAGNVTSLTRLADELGFTVHSIPPVKVGGLIVSSSKIRELVSAGKVGGAALLLGRPFALKGQVVRGDGRGASIGFPTANLRPENEQLPGLGVYVGRVSAHSLSTQRPAVINVGYTPTFGATGLKIEAHILDYTGPHLYGRALSVELIDKLRDEQRFDSVEALTEQIRRDIEAARRILRQ